MYSKTAMHINYKFIQYLRMFYSLSKSHTGDVITRLSYKTKAIQLYNLLKLSKIIIFLNLRATKRRNVFRILIVRSSWTLWL